MHQTLGVLIGCGLFKRGSAAFQETNRTKAQWAAPTRHGSFNYVQNQKSTKLKRPGSLKNTKRVMHQNHGAHSISSSGLFMRGSAAFPKTNRTKAQWAAPTRHGSLNCVQNWKSNKLEKISIEGARPSPSTAERGNNKASLKTNKRIMHPTLFFENKTDCA